MCSLRVTEHRVHEKRKTLCPQRGINGERRVPSLMIRRPALILKHRIQLPEGPTDSDQYSKQSGARTFEISRGILRSTPPGYTVCIGDQRARAPTLELAKVPCSYYD